VARLLVAEDYPPLAKVIAIACQREGYEVERAGSKARALALPGAFDLAVIDLDLVDGRGTDLALGLRREGRVGVVVFLASDSEHELCVTAAALGRVIQKESGVDELMACVRESLEHVRQLAQAVGSEHSASVPLARSGMHKRVR
jgi:DNA-binding response OmpR family regulator